MSLEATVKYAGGRYPFAAAASHVPGEVIVRPDGSLAILDGLDDVAIGDVIQPDPICKAPIVEVVANTADTWSAGADLYWDATANDLTTTAGSNVWIGRACAAKTAGQVLALVNTANDRPAIA